jgi:spore germination cell wall hydrolase CwlJ-like protein
MKLCVWREARGEGLLGKRGVAHVIVNRAADPCWWGDDIPSVILKPWQFSSFNVGDPNADKWPEDSDPSFQDCSDVCNAVLAGTDKDITGGATFYNDSSINEPTDWIKAGYILTLQVGRLSFYEAPTK